MTDEIYIVEKGNSMTHANSIEGVYANEQAAQIHRLALLYEYGLSSKNEYVDVRSYTLRTEAKNKPSFNYRIKYEDYLDPDSSESTTEWVDSYTKLLEKVEEFNNKDGAYELTLQRRTKDGEIEEATSTNGEFGGKPWDPSWW